MEMTKAKLKELCKKDSLFCSMPSLNDKLYLHYKGFSEVANLEEYTGLRCLWLEGNGLSRISGLEAQVDMRTLYLHENCITVIENLSHMVRRARPAAELPFPLALPPSLPLSLSAPTPTPLPPLSSAEGAVQPEPEQEQHQPHREPVRAAQAGDSAAGPQQAVLPGGH
jgi:hypothetical protein